MVVVGCADHFPWDAIYGISAMKMEGHTVVENDVPGNRNLIPLSPPTSAAFATVLVQVLPPQESRALVESVTAVRV